MSIVTLIFFICIFETCLPTLEVHPSNPKTIFIDKEYFLYFNMTLRKLNRKVGVVINADLYTTHGFGNNLTASLVLMESLSGRYQPTGVMWKYKLCDWLKNEPVLGRLWASYLPPHKNHCPFPKGRLQLTNATVSIGKFPHIPFTWAHDTVLTRMDVNITMTDTGKPLLYFYMHFSIKQRDSQPKRQKTSRKKPTSTPRPK